MIAREQVDFEPDKVLVRGVQRGLDAHLYWAVSLSTQNAAGLREECATVLVRRGDRGAPGRTVLARPV